MLLLWPRLCCLKNRVHFVILFNLYLLLTYMDYRYGNKKTRDIEPLLVQWWASVVDGGSTLNQQWLDVSCLLGLRVWALAQCRLDVGPASQTMDQHQADIGSLNARLLLNGIPNSCTFNLYTSCSPADTICWTNAVLMLGHHRRRWSDIEWTSRCLLEWDQRVLMLDGCHIVSVTVRSIAYY